MRSIKSLRLFIVITLVTVGCTPTTVSTQSKNDLLLSGYKQWNQFNILHKPFGDTIVFFSLRGDQTILSKTIFIPVDPRDSSMTRFFKSKGYIELAAKQNHDSVFYFNQSKGKIFQIDRSNKSKISLTQFGERFSFTVDL